MVSFHFQFLQIIFQVSGLEEFSQSWSSLSCNRAPLFWKNSYVHFFGFVNLQIDKCDGVRWHNIKQLLIRCVYGEDNSNPHNLISDDYNVNAPFSRFITGFILRWRPRIKWFRFFSTDNYSFIFKIMLMNSFRVESKSCSKYITNRTVLSLLYREKIFYMRYRLQHICLFLHIVEVRRLQIM